MYIFRLRANPRGRQKFHCFRDLGERGQRSGPEGRRGEGGEVHVHQKELGRSVLPTTFYTRNRWLVHVTRLFDLVLGIGRPENLIGTPGTSLQLNDSIRRSYRLDCNLNILINGDRLEYLHGIEWPIGQILQKESGNTELYIPPSNDGQAMTVDSRVGWYLSIQP